MDVKVVAVTNKGVNKGIVTQECESNKGLKQAALVGSCDCSIARHIVAVVPKSGLGPSSVATLGVSVFSG